MKQLFVLIALISFVASCRSPRAIGKAVGRRDSTVKPAMPAVVFTPKTDTLQQIKTALAQIADNRIPFTTFSAKVGVEYKGTDGKGHSVNANIKMYRDSVIWISVPAVLGVEAIRVLVTKDSVKLMNKLEKTYAARDIHFLLETTKLPLDLHTLQELFIGNPVYLDTNVIQFSRNANIITLISVGELFKNTATFNAADTSILHSKLTDVEPYRNRTADLSYSGYEAHGETPFSTKRQIIVSERGRLEIKLTFKNYSFTDEVSFPFRVPKNYSRQ